MATAPFLGASIDKLGPRIMYTGILVSGGAISIAFAWSGSYEQLALLRFLSGFIGAGFVVQDCRGITLLHIKIFILWEWLETGILIIWRF